MDKIKLPTSFAGIDGKEAFERIMSEPDVQVPEVPKATTQSNLENVLVFSSGVRIFVLDNIPGAVPIEVASRDSWIQALCSHDGKLYDGGNYRKVLETLTGREIASRNDYLSALCSHDGKLYDGGRYNEIFETMTN